MSAENLLLHGLKTGTLSVPKIEGNFKRGDIIVSHEQILARTEELAQEIAPNFRGKHLLIVPILIGGAIFGCDLLRALFRAGLYDTEMDFMGTSGYGKTLTSSGKVKITHNLQVDIAGRHVLIANDIIETGRDLKFLNEYLANRGPSGIYSAVLFAKPQKCRKVQIEPDWVGFNIPSDWVDGAGLDSYRLGRGNPELIKGPNPLIPQELINL